MENFMIIHACFICVMTISFFINIRNIDSFNGHRKGNSREFLFFISAFQIL